MEIFAGLNEILEVVDCIPCNMMSIPKKSKCILSTNPAWEFFLQQSRIWSRSIVKSCSRTALVWCACMLLFLLLGCVPGVTYGARRSSSRFGDGKKWKKKKNYNNKPPLQSHCEGSRRRRVRVRCIENQEDAEEETHKKRSVYTSFKHLLCSLGDSRDTSSNK